MSDLYTSGDYLAATDQAWHAEDSPWKASQVLQMIEKHALQPQTIAEIGCGAGQVLGALAEQASLQDCRFTGYDISPQAIKLCEKVTSDNCAFFCQDLLADSDDAPPKSDILLALDVFEHVPDYMGFVAKCKAKAEYKIYHIPLDIHVSSVLRNTLISARHSLGHLHYFTADSAIATLADTGHEIVDSFYTNGALDLFKQHPSVKRALANAPRWLFAKISLPFTARVFGGYSLLVLAK